MSDLISRSELLKEIEKYKFGAISNDAEREYIKKTILDFIICQPIAYDIDKVVEELEEIQGKAVSVKNEDISIYATGMMGKAIEIVKQGGVSDDVCEYENTDDEYCKWKINSVFLETINNPHVAERENIATAKYCPCCGKKIKVVE